MKVLTGVDIVFLPRFEKLMEDPAFVERVFTEAELVNHNLAHLAGLFAAKEAFFKATQVDIQYWRDLSVATFGNGKPYIITDLLTLPFQITSIDLSISHDGDYAVASVVVVC